MDIDSFSPLSLFLASICGTMFLLRRAQTAPVRSRVRARTWSINTRFSGTLSAEDEDYNEVLQHLFRAVKSSSRHMETSAPDDNQVRVTLTNEDLFQKRKSFFQNLAKETGMRADKVIHIAGSKGKGSCVEHIAAALRTSSARVGIFTSPHLHTARERIKINTDLISKADLTRIGRMTLAQTYNEYWPVFFDLFLAAAIRYFGEQQVEYVVLETGIGGRYDSTNFLDQASVGVITSISYDHMAILGNTLEEIAWQKAGIIKPGMHVFTPATQKPEVLEVIMRQCKEMSAFLHVVPVSQPNVSGVPDATAINFSVQVQNACVSLAVVQHLGLPASSMQGFFWPCRMEAFDVLCSEDSGAHSTGSSAVTEASQKRATVVLDGAHNGDSVKLFLQGLRSAYPGRHIHVLFGAGLEKCLGDMLTELSAQSDTVCFVQSKHFKAASEQELHDAAVRAGYSLPIPAHCTPQPRSTASTVGARLKAAITRQSHGGPDEQPVPVIAVCGSLFAAAEAREALLAMEPSLFAENDWVRTPDMI